jgi:DNA-binding Xre family transcriptional regulator
VNQYLEVTAIKKIVEDIGISRTKIADLKSGKRSLENIRLGIFETLVKYANGLEEA